MEKLKHSKDYQKAFNHAEMIISYMPRELEKLGPIEGVSPEYKRGFEDRLAMHEKEREQGKNFNLEDYKRQYQMDFDKGKDPSKEKGEDLEKEM
ncbi:MAG: hypothetical protein JXR03_18495 [Cyclobacteriaceae bacterium]